jgi:hypothetical protein
MADEKHPDYEEFDLSDVRTYPLSSRASKVRAEDFARPFARGSGIAGLIASLPGMLAAADFRIVVERIASARRTGAGILWGVGAHVIKTGLGPVLIDLMTRGYVSALATNGAGIIHDFEIALSGATSEDVDETLGPGRFGMAEETGTLLNAAINAGVASGAGIGEAVAAWLQASAPPFEHLSVVAAAERVRRRAWRGEPPRLSALRDERGPARGGRVPELRVCRDPPRSVSEGGRSRPQPRHRAGGDDDGQPGLPAPVSAADERRIAADEGEWPGLLAGRAPRAHDPAAGCSAD